MPDDASTGWSEVVREQTPRLRATIARRLDSRVARRVSVSDLVQETLLEAAHRRETPAGLPVGVCLLSLVRDKLLQAHRAHLADKRDARRELPALPVAQSSLFVRAVRGTGGTPSQAAAQAEDTDRLRRALAELDDDDRDVILGRHFEQLSNREVAFLLGITEAAAGKRYLRALDRLRMLLFAAARTSTVTLRGLSGEDRAVLYSLAAGTGYRANALANLTPADFDFAAGTVTLPARFNKSSKVKVQPLPPDVAAAVAGYAAGRPAGEPLWGGTWAERAADMIRADVEAADIPYAVPGPDGPRFADFHSLRHIYLTMLGRNGLDLRTAQELAGHSSPVLTARYSHRNLADLTAAVGKLTGFAAGTAPAGGPTAVANAVAAGGHSEALARTVWHSCARW